MSEMIVFHLVSGDALYSGALLFLIALALFSSSRQRALRVLAGISVLSGVALAFLSAAPTPLWLLATWFVVTVTWLFLEFIRSTTFRKTRCAVRGITAVVILAVISLEIPHLLTPRVSCPPGTIVCVIGDSISAGIDNSCGSTWPALLSSRYDLDFINLARAGATAHTARQQTENIPQDAALVILEIGGNDLLKNYSARTFRADLDKLLADVTRPDRDIVMFELPLLPTCNAFGRAQRDLAAKYNVPLIPKRRFAHILTTGGTTIDGLHLSPQGHEEMAALVWQVLVR